MDVFGNITLIPLKDIDQGGFVTISVIHLKGYHKRDFCSDKSSSFKRLLRGMFFIWITLIPLKD